MDGHTVIHCHFTKYSVLIQVNLFQKHVLLHQLTHNMTKYCSLNYKFSAWKFEAQNMLTLHVYINSSECQNKNKQFVYTTCSEHGIFMHWTLQFKGQSFVIFRVSWCKNKCFWKKLTFTSLASQNRMGGRHELAPVLSSRDLVKTVRVDTGTWKKKSKFNQNLQVQALADPIRFTKGVCF